MRKKKDLIIIVISIIVIGINTISLSKYDYVANGNAQTEIAKAILVLEKDEMVTQQIDENSFPLEYNFVIHNYEGEKINEVDFEYNIEIEALADNFPVSYMLFDCDNNTEIKLTEGKTENMSLQKFEEQTRKFKLYMQWRELDGELAEDIEIKLKINGIQSKEDKINENTKNRASIAH